jgi:hypothetical protein
VSDYDPAIDDALDEPKKAKAVDLSGSTANG